jgi:hypothetical protein
MWKPVSRPTASHGTSHLGSSARLRRRSLPSAANLHPPMSSRASSGSLGRSQSCFARFPSPRWARDINSPMGSLAGLLRILLRLGVSWMLLMHSRRLRLLYKTGMRTLQRYFSSQVTEPRIRPVLCADMGPSNSEHRPVCAQSPALFTSRRGWRCGTPYHIAIRSRHPSFSLAGAGGSPWLSSSCWLPSPWAPFQWLRAPAPPSGPAFSRWPGGAALYPRLFASAAGRRPYGHADPAWLSITAYRRRVTATQGTVIRIETHASAIPTPDGRQERQRWRARAPRSRRGRRLE